MPSNVTTHHTGAVDVATVTDTEDGVEAGSTATTKAAKIKQGVASQECETQAEGHVETATFTNMQGGSTANCE